MMATKTSVTVFHSGLPIGMLHALASDMFSGIKSATVGNNGTWAIITSSGKLVSDLHDPNVHNVLKDGRRIKVRTELAVFIYPSDQLYAVHGS